MLVLGMLVTVVPASAHRLDEYAQVIAVSIADDLVTLDLRLTPGQLVAGEVLAVIDSDGDGTISPSEQTRYVDTIVSDLAVMIDGKAIHPSAASTYFATEDEIRQGIGIISLTLQVGVAPAATHVLRIENRHMPTRSVYLVNALQPRDSSIEIMSQDRSYFQNTYEMAWSAH